MKLLLLALLIGFSSCSLFDGFKKQEFSVESRNSFQILVPKGWNKVTNVPDSAGNKEQFYYYPDGSYFYVSNTGKQINPNEKIDTARHIPLQHAAGGVVYKGVMPGLLFWREIQKMDYRFGYRNVPTDLESRFDSAVNYSALMNGFK